MRSKGAIDLPCFRKQHTTFTCLWFCYESKPWGPRYPIHPNLERMGFDPSAFQWTAGRKSNHSLTWKVRLLWDSYPNPARIILVMSWHEVATIYQFIQIGSICNIASVGYTLPQCNLLKKNHPWLKSELHWVTGNCHIWWRVFLAHLWWNNPWLAFGINHLNLETEFWMSVVRKSECSGHSGDSTAKLNPPCLEFDSFDALKLFMPAPLQWQWLNGKQFYFHVCFKSFFQFL